MFESLTDRFDGIFTRLRSRGRLSPADVDEVLREIRTALLEADVEIGVVRTFTTAVRDRCVGLELSQSLSPGQQVIKIVNEELVAILGGETLQIRYASRPPTVILLAGLQGSGKTTASAKLARWFKQQGRNPLLVGADLQRPAAVEQRQFGHARKALRPQQPPHAARDFLRDVGLAAVGRQVAHGYDPLPVISSNSEAIQTERRLETPGLLRCARNDE